MWRLLGVMANRDIVFFRLHVFSLSSHVYPGGFGITSSEIGSEGIVVERRRWGIYNEWIRRVWWIVSFLTTEESRRRMNKAGFIRKMSFID